MKKVPFDKGYYAEFKVKDFSEFWLNNGGFDKNQPLPVQLISFSARKKSGKDVLAEWTTASEFNVNDSGHCEIYWPATYTYQGLERVEIPKKLVLTYIKL